MYLRSTFVYHSPLYCCALVVAVGGTSLYRCALVVVVGGTSLYRCALVVAVGGTSLYCCALVVAVGGTSLYRSALVVAVGGAAAPRAESWAERAHKSAGMRYNRQEADLSELLNTVRSNIRGYDMHHKEYTSRVQSAYGPKAY